VATKLADVRLRDESDAKKRVSRWRRIALEAAKQSGRALVPEVAMAVSFTALVDNATATEQRKLMFSEREGQSLSECKASLSDNRQSMTALVGSEGGWTDEEVSLARESNWAVVTLGGRTLRAETAAIAATVLLEHLYGDLD